MTESAPLYKDYHDGLRVISCFLVIVTHVFGNLQISIISFSKSYLLLWTIWQLSLIAVPMFVMISGSNFLNKKSPTMKKYIFKLVKIYVCWMCIYFALFLFYSIREHWIDTLSFHTLLERALSLPDYAYHLWYLPLMICLYLLEPVLELIKDKSAYFVKLNIAVLIITAFIAVLRLANFNILDNVFKQPIGLFNIFILFFVMGYYLSSNSNVHRRLLYISSSVLTICFLITNILYRVKLNLDFSGTFLYFRDSIICVLLCAAIYVFFKEHYQKLPLKLRQGLKHLSSYSLGVYLIHVFYVNIFTALRGKFASTNVLIFGSLSAIAIFLLCYATAFVMKRLPLLRSII